MGASEEARLKDAIDYMKEADKKYVFSSISLLTAFINLTFSTVHSSSLFDYTMNECTHALQPSYCLCPLQQ